MTVWVVWFYDVGPIVEGIYATELEARRAAGDQIVGFRHVSEVALPCVDFDSLVKGK